MGLGDVESFKAATVLSGGIAGRGETCGALIGGLMALGLAKGRDRIEDTAQYRKAIPPALEVSRRFQQDLQAECGFAEPLTTTLCRDIHVRLYGRAFDLTDPVDYRAFQAAGAHSPAGCPRVCSVAARVTAQQLLRPA
jgi:C_GCAxxG_C_C family probable redox protein